MNQINNLLLEISTEVYKKLNKRSRIDEGAMDTIKKKVLPIVLSVLMGAGIGAFALSKMSPSKLQSVIDKYETKIEQQAQKSGLSQDEIDRSLEDMYPDDIADALKKSPGAQASNLSFIQFKAVMLPKLEAKYPGMAKGNLISRVKDLYKQYQKNPQDFNFDGQTSSSKQKTNSNSKVLISKTAPNQDI